MNRSTPYPLARSIRRLLDIVKMLAIAGFVLWLGFVVMASVGQRSEPHSWGVDISFFARYSIDLQSIPGSSFDNSSVRDPVISGTGETNIDTSSLKALYWATFILSIGAAVGLFIVLQLRALFFSLEKGVAFSVENTQRIRTIGITAIVWALLAPFLQYYGGKAILAEYALSVSGISLAPAFSINTLAVFIGVSMLVLSGILSEAEKMRELQELTV